MLVASHSALSYTCTGSIGLCFWWSTNVAPLLCMSVLVCGNDCIQLYILYSAVLSTCTALDWHGQWHDYQLLQVFSLLLDSRESNQLHVKWKEATQVPLPTAGEGKPCMMQHTAMEPHSSSTSWKLLSIHTYLLNTYVAVKYCCER